jgi:autotransporter-associated beta strand protein
LDSRKKTSLMKASFVLSKFVLASFLLAAANSAHAQATYYWDEDADTTTDTGGAGIWDITSSLWRSGSDIGDLSLWPNTDPAVDTAQFAGTAGTIALNSDSANLNFSRIVFATTGYEIAAPASGTATLNVSGASPARITTNTSVSTTISAGISGASTISLNKAGAGTLTLSGVNTLTGPITVSASNTSGGILNISGDQSTATGWINDRGGSWQEHHLEQFRRDAFIECIRHRHHQHDEQPKRERREHPQHQFGGELDTEWRHVCPATEHILRRGHECGQRGQFYLQRNRQHRSGEKQ